VRREDVCAGLRGARAEIEKRLDGTHWLRFGGRYLPLQACPAATRSATPSGLWPTGLADRKLKPQQLSKPKYIPPPDHPWRGHFYLAEKRTFLLCIDSIMWSRTLESNRDGGKATHCEVSSDR
jgi:hypothetical protein